MNGETANSRTRVPPISTVERTSKLVSVYLELDMLRIKG